MAIEDVKPEEIPEAMKAALESARAANGEVFVLTAPESGVTVICKRPGRALYRKFREEQDGPPAKSAHRFENLFNSCLVYPSPKDFDATLDRLPALGDSFGLALWDKIVGAENVTTKRSG